MQPRSCQLSRRVPENDLYEKTHSKAADKKNCFWVRLFFSLLLLFLYSFNTLKGVGVYLSGKAIFFSVCCSKSNFTRQQHTARAFSWKVTHPLSTDHDRCCLTSVFLWEPMFLNVVLPLLWRLLMIISKINVILQWCKMY